MGVPPGQNVNSYVNGRGEFILYIYMYIYTYVQI